MRTQSGFFTREQPVAPSLTDDEIRDWLHETSPQRLAELWHRADEVRRVDVGDAVHLRGLVEISNHCVRQCWYCGVRAGNHAIERYRMDADEVMACAYAAREYGYGTVVLQAGEDPALTTDWVTGLIHRIKDGTGLAVTLSLGERDDGELSAWRDAGADRYLLRFETSDPALYRRIHPPPRRGRPRRGGSTSVGELSDGPGRIALLQRLRGFGYEIGSGIMVGIPGQTYASVAHDIALFRSLDPDMVGIGPYIAHPHTPLGDGSGMPTRLPPDQITGDKLMVCKVMALTRLVCPQANIPSTTALATIDKESGRESGLRRGANVVMPNLTPPTYRRLYEIYPGKDCANETAERCHVHLAGRIQALGRHIGTGPGGRRRNGPTAAPCLPAS